MVYFNILLYLDKVHLRSFFISIVVLNFFAWGCGQEKGCTDSASISYNPMAEIDDGTCKYPDESRIFPLLFFTSSACEACGSFSSPIFQSFSNQSDGFFPVSVYSVSQDSLFCPAGVNLVSGLNVQAFPSFAVGNQTGLTTASELSQAISLEQGLKARVGLEASRNAGGGDSPRFTVRGYLHNEVPGTLLVNVWAIQEQTVAPQAGVGPSHVHLHVLRAAGSGNAFGEEASQEAGEQGLSFLKEVELTLDPAWSGSAIRFVAVVWSAQLGSYTFENAAIIR